MRESTMDRDPFERLAEEFADRLRRGEHPSITEYIERYPEHADDIRELFPALALVEQYKPEQTDLEIASSGPVTRGDLPDQLGDYRILRYLGEGGMGVVYEAVRESLRSHVALKVMHPHFRNREKYLRRFRTEACSAARLHHTNIVSVFDFGVHDGVCYYAMQYIAGHSLDKILAEVRQLRGEKAGFAAAATETAATADDSEPVLIEANLHGRAGCVRTNSLRQTVTVGLLTGHYSTASPAEASDDVDDAPPPTGTTATGWAIESTDQMKGCAETSALGPWTAHGEEIEQAENASRQLEFEPRRARAVIAPAHESPPDLGEAQSREEPAFDGSTSTLTGTSDACYYREVARLGAQIADALAYAHKRDVLHRDIKPPNLILDPLGNIWITDFGLAKFEDGEDLSQSHDIVGTVCYMAPERFRGVSNPQCDLYSLGATLYELLTLRPAFEGGDQLQLIHRIANEPPVPPRQIERGIPQDLETIVLKSLAKNPRDRFATAEEMAAELRRVVENRPIVSRPIAFYQRFWRWCKRNPGLAGANIAAATLTTILAIVSTVAAWSYREQRDQVRRSETQANEKLFESLVSQARATRFSHRQGQRFDSLEALRKAAVIGQELKLPNECFETLRDEAIACMALPDLRADGRVISRPSGAWLCAFNSTMTRYALRFRDGTIQVRQVADDAEIAHFQARGDRGIWVFGFSPDGRYLATTHRPGLALTVWDVDRLSVALQEPGPVNDYAARFSPDSQRIAVGHQDGELLVYDLATGQPSSRWRGPKMRDLAFGRDGTQVAAICEEKGATCRILEVETGRLVRPIPLPPGVSAVAWSPDGTTLATPGYAGKIYLSDAATGIRRATLEGHINSGLVAAFDHAGVLMASSGWEGRLWFWDPISGRPWFNLTGVAASEFSREGRIVVWLQDKLTTYQADPALEYRTFAHVSRELNQYHRASIRGDGRILAVGTTRGVILWDLGRATELGFLSIGNAWHLMFEPSGDLITSGESGVQRWPFQFDVDGSEFRIGPPRRLPLPAAPCGIEEDRSGRILAMAHFGEAHVLTPERALRVGPLDDCRSVAVSPDGEWLGTGSHVDGGVQIWRITSGTEVARLPIDGGTGVHFSPCGNWLMTTSAPCRLWAVGTWREVRQIGGEGRCFSPDGRLLVVQDAGKALRLVGTETGRTVAQLESPDLHGVQSATFSPDGVRLVVTTNDGPAVHVWDLRAIRRNLAEMGLDWDAPAYPDTDPAAETTPPPPWKVVVNMGTLDGELKPLLQRSQRYQQAGKIGEAISMLRQAVRLSPDLAEIRNDLAWLLVTAPEPLRNPAEALEHTSHAIRLAPGEPIYLNTWGVALYRTAQFAEAIETLEKSLEAGRGKSDACDLFFLAMAHHRLGHHQAARRCLDRALRWLREKKNLTEQSARELATFRAEAEAVLAGPAIELPADVFAFD